MQKKYSIKELSSILGCSVTAVQKKISVDENNPNLKRYRNRYEVVIDDGKSVILLTDEELEQEKRLSKGFKNVSKNVDETSENVIDVDYTHENTINKDDTIDKVLKFTESYIERYETLQKSYYNLLNEKDNQLKLLTDSEHKTKDEFYQVTAKCKELEEKNKYLKRLLYVVSVVITVLIMLFLKFITF